MGFRTVQRAEGGNAVRAERLAQIAKALAVPPHELQRGHFDVREAMDVAREYTCRHCGAKLAHRIPVSHEEYDDEVDIFECGAETGHRERPCPKDPRFPRFEDYELHTHRDGDRFYTDAFGRTEMAKAVSLRTAFGATEASSQRWLHREFIRLRDGEEAAEAFLAFDAHLREG